MPASISGGLSPASSRTQGDCGTGTAHALTVRVDSTYAPTRAGRLSAMQIRTAGWYGSALRMRTAMWFGSVQLGRGPSMRLRDVSCCAAFHRSQVCGRSTHLRIAGASEAGARIVTT